MKINNKYFIVVPLILISLLVTNFVLAKSEEGQPFKFLWDAIINLQDQITNIQLIPGPQGEIGSDGPQGERGTQGEQGPIGPEGQQGLSGTGFKVLDGTGKDLGYLVGADLSGDTQYYTTYDKDNDVFIPVESDFRNRTVIIAAGQYGGVFFEGANCTGQPFSRNQSGSSIARHKLIEVFGPRYFTYKPLVLAGPATRTSLSYLTGNSCNNTASETKPGTFVLEEVLFLFSEPLSWPLNIQ